MFDFMGKIFAWIERRTGLDEEEIILCFLLVLLAFPVHMHKQKKCWIVDHTPQASTIECR